MKEKQRKKSGVSRLFEIAGEKKGLLMLAGVLSAVSALCMLVPYWSVYEVLKELLLHGSKISELDSSVLIHWGWHRMWRRSVFSTGCAFVCPGISDAFRWDT